MAELITLQFGNFANYVGTHYWNIQEKNYSYCEAQGEEQEIESSILWRSDENNGGTLKYTPRTIIVDLKDSKGGLSREGCIVREKQEQKVTTWNNTTTFASEPTKSNPAFDVTDETQQTATEPPASPQIEYWSDFLGLDFNKNSIFEFSDYRFGIHAFDKFSDGQAFLTNAHQVEELEDVVRRFLEEANSPQGFQIFANTYDGFGAVASGIIEKLNDEFAKPSITFGVSPSNIDPQGDDVHHMINTSLSMAGLSKASSVYVPVVMDWSFFSNRLKTHKAETMYHSSAVIAASIDAATLNYRSFSRTVDFVRTTSILAPITEWNICSLHTSFPFEIDASRFATTTQDALTNIEKESDFASILHPLIPLYTMENNKVFGQTVSLRGPPKGMPLNNVRELLERALHIPERQANCLVVNQPFEAPKTFPSLLYKPPFYPRAVAAQLQTSKALYPYLSELTQTFTKIKPVAHKYPEVDYAEAYETLYSTSEGYAK